MKSGIAFKVKREKVIARLEKLRINTDNLISVLLFPCSLATLKMNITISPRPTWSCMTMLCCGFLNYISGILSLLYTNLGTRSNEAMKRRSDAMKCWTLHRFNFSPELNPTSLHRFKFSLALNASSLHQINFMLTLNVSRLHHFPNSPLLC